MSTSEVIHTLFDYHFALFDRVWQSIDQLAEEQFVAPVDYSHGSIRDQIVHVAAADRRWMKGLQGDPAARQFTLDPADYPSKESVRALWQSTAQQLRDYVTALDEDELAATAPGMMGPTWQVLVHMVNHGTDHRAQVLHALAGFGAPTFDQDLIFHLWMA